MSAIWFNKELTLKDLQASLEGNMSQYLEMEWVAIHAGSLVLKMPVNPKTMQPYGILHGGASCALAETIGSIGSHLVIDSSRYRCVGLEINANHICSISEGFVFATATPVHLGRSTHIWDIRITSAFEKLVCISRLTVAILEKKNV